jgi:UDPglucose 6-dehydrogenase
MRAAVVSIFRMGLSFRPETDDIREAVSIPVINGLLTEGVKVTVWDPEAMIEATRIFGSRIRYATGASECLEHADCCILATEWADFNKLEPKTFLDNMRQPIVIDGRRVYDPSELRNAGICFHVIGLGPD